MKFGLSKVIVLLTVFALGVAACEDQDPLSLNDPNDTTNNGSPDASTNNNGERDAGPLADADNDDPGPDEDTGSDENNGEPDGGDENANNGEPDGPAIDSKPCEQDSDCLGGTCLSSADWPDGYCTTLHCETFEDCANDEESSNACLINPNGANFCVQLCDPTIESECRDDYQCQPLSGGDQGWCAGDPEDAGSGDPADISFDITCEPVSGQTANIEFDIDSSTDSYMIVPLTANGETLSPVNITTPSGQVIDFQGSNNFQAVGAQLFGSVNPTIVPAIPQFESQMETGSHTYTLYTNDSEMCHYILEAPGNPTVVDLNIYLVGVSGITPENAATNSSMQTVLNRAESIYNQAGISFGEIRYLDVPSEAEQAYSVIQSEGDIRQLASYSENPENDGGSAVSANIFITSQFSMGGALGLSLGIPGAAGIHGSGISGVAMTGEYMGSNFGNLLSGNVLAHELGHFLGLFHTSEQNGQTFDPLDDTGQCTNFSNPTGCPDWGNLMFPSADGDNTELTNDQSFVLGVNPLTK